MVSLLLVLRLQPTRMEVPTIKPIKSPNWPIIMKTSLNPSGVGRRTINWGMSSPKEKYPQSMTIKYKPIGK